MTRTIFAILAALGLSMALAACGNDGGDATAADSGAAQGGAGDSMNEDINASLGTQEMVLGDPDAPVTLTEYASVTCPSCAAFHTVAYPRLKEEYIDTGKVRLVFREFPTSPPQLSYLGSTLARCAAERSGNKDAYFAMVKTLFANQQAWVSNDFRSELMSYAAQAGIGEQAFRDCASRDDIIETINANVRIGQNEGVRGTPTFLVDGEQLRISGSYDSFFVALNEKLVAAGVEVPETDTDETGAEETEVVPQTEADPQ